MRDDLRQNQFKRGLAGSSPQIGFWLSLCSPTATEIAAGAGFDWLLVDMEHSPNETPDVAQNLRAAEGGTAEPMVRVPWNDMVMLKRVLDLGAQTFLIPFVQNAAEAEAAVRATRYPPHGVRGVAGTTRATRYGRVKDYFTRAQQEICVVVQVETRAALAEIEAIAKIDGVDGIFVGPNDLAADFGYPGQPSRPEIWSVILEAGKRIRATGKAAGTLLGRDEDIRQALDAGYNFVAVGSDNGVLARQADMLATKYR